VKPTSRDFKIHARVALQDGLLQRALSRAKDGFISKRQKALDELPEFADLRAAARRIRDHVLAHLDSYLERFESRVKARGGQVHWARNAEQACQQVVALCRAANAQRVIKGKSMVGEEVGLNAALEAAGLKVTETDLGEYIIQLAGEPPSHIIAPAVHKSRGQVAELFAAHHGPAQRREGIAALVNEARRILREHFVNADVGITGANFLIAETGSAVLVTNEGNGDLSSTLPRMHIVIATLEKVVPTLEDATLLLRLLGRSATGQEMTAYTTFITGPRYTDDADGPEAFHVVLVDNGRTRILGSEFRDMLRCIRCGACLNYCPVYEAIGGHAYGWVYPGPMGSVLTPLLVGLEQAGDLPNASSFCGRCAEVCPVEIPLPDLLRHLRARQFDARLTAPRQRWALRVWAFLARHPGLYHRVTGLTVSLLGRLGTRKGTLRRVPLAGAWTAQRDLPAPQGETFRTAWHRHHRAR
jgi:L-lactate dehydrogenase complex protein LldF